MAIVHCSIKLFSSQEKTKEEIELFAVENWTKESEIYLLALIQQLLAQLRPLAQTLHFDVQVQVPDTVGASIILQKKFGQKNLSLHTQKLTEREQQVMDLIVQGYTNKEIAHQLFISLETVRSHRKHIMLKTGSKNTALLVKYYDRLLAAGAEPFAQG